MIAVLGTAHHAYTHRTLVEQAPFELEVIPYPELWERTELPRATYVFTDMDRLGFWELELAARLFRRLRKRGLRVLNDPARVLQRYGLLRTLHARGINRFGVWRVEDPVRSLVYPVFLRTASAHRGVISDLLHDEAAVDEAVEAALVRGIPRRELLLVEYCAEPAREGVFRKLAMYRVADRLVPVPSVHESGWAAKQGELGIAGEELYRDEHDFIANGRWGDDLWPAFRAAEIEYGRADFGLVDGQVQVYEINTNPMIKPPLEEHPFPVRVESSRLSFEKLIEAFQAIDSPAGPALDDAALGGGHARDRLWHRTGVLP